MDFNVIVEAAETIFLGQQVSVVGSILLLAAYGLMQFGIVKTESYLYQLFNLFGAACLTYSVIKPFNVGVFVTEFCWTIFSIVGVYKTWQALNGKGKKKDIPDPPRVQ